MKKKIVALSIAILLAFITACGTQAQVEEEHVPEPELDVETLSVEEIAETIVDRLGGAALVIFEEDGRVLNEIGANEGAEFKVANETFELFHISDENILRDARTGTFVTETGGWEIILNCVVRENFVLAYNSRTSTAERVIELFIELTPRQN